jgi:hypothetical protein
MHSSGLTRRRGRGTYGMRVWAQRGAKLGRLEGSRQSGRTADAVVRLRLGRGWCPGTAQREGVPCTL